MGTGSVESLVLKWLRRLPTVPVPFFGPSYSSACASWASSESGWASARAALKKTAA